MPLRISDENDKRSPPHSTGRYPPTAEPTVIPIQTRLFRPIDHACCRHRIIGRTQSILHGDIFPTQAMKSQPGRPDRAQAPQ